MFQSSGYLRPFWSRSDTSHFLRHPLLPIFLNILCFVHPHSFLHIIIKSPPITSSPGGIPPLTIKRLFYQLYVFFIHNNGFTRESLQCTHPLHRHHLWQWMKSWMDQILMNGDGWTKLVWDKSSDFLKSMGRSGDEPHLGLL